MLTFDKVKNNRFTMKYKYDIEDLERAIDNMTKHFNVSSSYFKIKPRINKNGELGKNNRGKNRGHKITVKGKYLQWSDTKVLLKKWGERLKMFYPYKFEIKAYCIEHGRKIGLRYPKSTIGESPISYEENNQRL